MEYTPEIGQLCFGQPWKRYELPVIWEAALDRINRELERVWWNVKQAQLYSPFHNSGADSFVCDEFEVHPYNWGEEDDHPCNFKCGEVEVSWYKHSWRGQSINVEPTAELAEIVLRKCLLALAQWEHDNTHPDLRINDRPSQPPT